MKAYRFYFVGTCGGFVDVVELLCASDEDALSDANERCRCNRSVEVWQQGRFVSRIDRRAAA